MANSFDPYAEWLGISKQKVHPDRYRLLNLAPFESNPDVIEQAAALQSRHVAQFLTGEHAADAQRLIDEINSAQACLLDPGKKTIYDNALRTQQAVRGEEAPPPSAAQAPQAAAPTFAPAVTPATSAPLHLPATSEIDSWLPPVADGSAEALLPMPVDPGLPSAMPVNGYPPMAQPVPAQPYGGPLAAPAYPMAAPAYPQAVPAYPAAAPYAAAPYAPAAVPMAAYPAAVPAYPQAMPVDPYGGMPAAQGAATALLEDDGLTVDEQSPEPAAAPVNAARIAAQRGRNSVMPLVMGLAAMLLVVFGVGAGMYKLGYLKLGAPQEQEVASRPVDDKTSGPRRFHTTNTSRTGDVDVAPMQGKDDPPPTKTDDLGMSDDPPAEMPADPAAMPDKPDMPAPDDSDPKPEMTKPDETPEPETKPARPVGNLDVAKTLMLARNAMVARDMARALQLIDKAAEVAEGPQVADVARLKLIHNYVGQFWHGVDESLKAIPEGEDFPYKDDRISVVEKGPKILVLRMGGMNKEFDMSALPSKLAMVFAERYFNKDPANYLVMGAYLVVHPKGDREKALDLWTEAARRGLKEQADAVMPELNVQIAEVTESEALGQVGVPSAPQVVKAREEIRQLFQDDLAAAKSPPERIVLADKLLTQGLDSQDAVQRYALLAEARDQAALSGDTDALSRVADSLASLYTIDAETAKTEGLQAAEKAADSPETFAAVAQAALDLTDAAMLTEQYTEAKKRVTVALAAANKSKDEELKKQARSQNKDVQAQLKKK